MKPVLATKALDYLREGENLRPITVDDGIRELCHSIVASGLLQPVSAIDHGDYGVPIIGFRRLAALRWGLSENLSIPSVIPVMLYPPTITPVAVKVAQITENLQRVDLTDQQLFLAVVELVRLGLPLADIASTLNVSKPSACRYLAPDRCPPEAKEHFLAERLTLGQCYKIATSPDQLATMAVFLNGGTHEKAEKQTKQRDITPREKTARVKIPLAGSIDDFEIHGIVTISRLPGEEIDLEGAENLLKQAMRSVKEAQKKGWTLKSAMNAWRDTAMAN